jgi:hypothetical protein
MKYSSAIEAAQKGSLCNFQLELSIKMPSFGLPALALPELPSIPGLKTFAPAVLPASLPVWFAFVSSSSTPLRWPFASLQGAAPCSAHAAVCGFSGSILGKMLGIRTRKTLEAFDWNFQPKLDKGIHPRARAPRLRAAPRRPADHRQKRDRQESHPRGFGATRLPAAALRAVQSLR